MERWNADAEAFVPVYVLKNAPKMLQTSGGYSPDSAETASTASQSDSELGQATRVLGRLVECNKTYSSKFVVRPDNPDVAKLLVLAYDRLTPDDYDRTIFHLALRVHGTSLANYDVGDSIGIYPQNPPEKVSSFLAGKRLDATELLELDTYFTGLEDGVFVMSVLQFCTEYLDLFGAPTRAFYLALSKFAGNYLERVQLAELSLPRKKLEFEEREASATTYASTMLEFSSVKITPMDLLDLIPLTKPRLYSIASSPQAHPGEVHLLLVTHTWESSKAEDCTGLASGYLEQLQPNQSELPLQVVASLVRSPILKLPREPARPVIMAGMGTGMAPFRGFIEERAVMRRKAKQDERRIWREGQAATYKEMCQDLIGACLDEAALANMWAQLAKVDAPAVGPMRLYFGARHKQSEFLYQNELEEYAAEGWLTLHCAWSRDQAHKVYVQNLIENDAEAIWEALCPEVAGSFYVCGPMGPLPDIKKALVKIFEHNGSGKVYLDEMEAAGRFSTEVY